MRTLGKGVQIAFPLVTIALAIFAAHWTISEGRNAATEQQRLLAEQVGSRLDELLLDTHTHIRSLAPPSPTKMAHRFLEDTLQRFSHEGWVGINLIHLHEGTTRTAGVLDHAHHGEGYVACPLCAEREHLLLASRVDDYQIEVAVDLSAIRHTLFAQPSGSEVFVGRVLLLAGDQVLIDLSGATQKVLGDALIASIPLERTPGLHIRLIQPEGRLTAGLRHGVYLQLAALCGFTLLVAAAFLQLKHSANRERLANAETNKMRTELHQRSAHLDRLASVGILAASVAHELANPLTYVMSSMDMALEVSTEEGHQELIELLSEGLQGCDRVTTILNDMRTFSHPSKQGSDVVDLAEVIQAAGRIANARLRTCARLELQLEDLPPILGNASRLGQVFLNLFLNAADAISEQRQDVGQSLVTVSSEFRSAKHPLRVVVQDDGPGIPSELHHKIFDTFFTTKPPEKGTGLGLAICRDIVREHGGELILEPSEKGARFVVTLPVSERPIHTRSLLRRMTKTLEMPTNTGPTS